MALPTQNDLLGLGWGYEGASFVTFQAGTADTSALSFGLEGTPFWASGGGSSVGTNTTLRWDLDGAASPSADVSRAFFMFF